MLGNKHVKRAVASAGLQSPRLNAQSLVAETAFMAQQYRHVVVSSSESSSTRKNKAHPLMPAAQQASTSTDIHSNLSSPRLSST